MIHIHVNSMHRPKPPRHTCGQRGDNQRMATRTMRPRCHAAGFFGLMYISLNPGTTVSSSLLDVPLTLKLFLPPFFLGLPFFFLLVLPFFFCFCFSLLHDAADDSDDDDDDDDSLSLGVAKVLPNRAAFCFFFSNFLRLSSRSFARFSLANSTRVGMWTSLRSSSQSFR